MYIAVFAPPAECVAPDSPFFGVFYVSNPLNKVPEVDGAPQEEHFLNQMGTSGGTGHRRYVSGLQPDHKSVQCAGYVPKSQDLNLPEANLEDILDKLREGNGIRDGQFSQFDDIPLRDKVFEAVQRPFPSIQWNTSPPRLADRPAFNVIPMRWSPFPDLRRSNPRSSSIMLNRRRFTGYSPCSSAHSKYAA